MDLFIGTSTANKEWRRRILLYKGIEVVGAGKFDVDYYFPESVEKRRLEKIRQEEERKKAEELERIRTEEQAKEEERKYQAQLEQLEIYMRNRTRTERKVQLERICKTDTLLRKKEAESPYIVEAYRIASQQDLSSVYTYLQNFQPVTGFEVPKSDRYCGHGLLEEFFGWATAHGGVLVRSETEKRTEKIGAGS